MQGVTVPAVRVDECDSPLSSSPEMLRRFSGRTSPQPHNQQFLNQFSSKLVNEADADSLSLSGSGNTSPPSSPSPGELVRSSDSKRKAQRGVLLESPVADRQHKRSRSISSVSSAGDPDSDFGAEVVQGLNHLSVSQQSHSRHSRHSSAGSVSIQGGEAVPGFVYGSVFSPNLNFPASGSFNVRHSADLPSQANSTSLLSVSHTPDGSLSAPSSESRSRQSSRSSKSSRGSSAGAGKHKRKGSDASNDASIKGNWTEAEDAQLKTLVAQHGTKNWTTIAKSLSGRAGKQCRERWFNHLDSSIRKTPWTEEEDALIIMLHSELGNKWAEIAKYPGLLGRPSNAIKNHWNSALHRRAGTDAEGRRAVKTKTVEENPPKTHRRVKSTSAATNRRTHPMPDHPIRGASVASVSVPIGLDFLPAEHWNAAPRNQASVPAFSFFPNETAANADSDMTMTNIGNMTNVVNMANMDMHGGYIPPPAFGLQSLEYPVPYSSSTTFTNDMQPAFGGQHQQPATNHNLMSDVSHMPPMFLGQGPPVAARDMMPRESSTHPLETDLVFHGGERAASFFEDDGFVTSAHGLAPPGLNTSGDTSLMPGLPDQPSTGSLGGALDLDLMLSGVSVDLGFADQADDTPSDAMHDV